MLPLSELAQVIAGLRLRAYEGPTYRAVQLRHLPTLTSTIGGLRAYNRYTVPQLSEALYVADGPDQAMLEATRQFQAVFGPSRVPGYAIYPITLDLERVLDLTREDVYGALGTTLMELTGDWRAARAQGLRVVTHDLGRAAFEVGVQALRFPSAYHTDEGRFNLVVFTEHAQNCFQEDLEAEVAEAIAHLAVWKAQQARRQETGQ